jgi:hypothetical protein
MRIYKMKEVSNKVSFLKISYINTYPERVLAARLRRLVQSVHVEDGAVASHVTKKSHHRI